MYRQIVSQIILQHVCRPPIPDSRSGVPLVHGARHCARRATVQCSRAVQRQCSGSTESRNGDAHCKGHGRAWIRSLVGRVTVLVRAGRGGAPHSTALGDRLPVPRGRRVGRSPQRSFTNHVPRYSECRFSIIEEGMQSESIQADTPQRLCTHHQRQCEPCNKKDYVVGEGILETGWSAGWIAPPALQHGAPDPDPPLSRP